MASKLTKCSNGTRLLLKLHLLPSYHAINSSPHLLTLHLRCLKGQEPMAAKLHLLNLYIYYLAAYDLHVQLYTFSPNIPIGSWLQIHCVHQLLSKCLVEDMKDKFSEISFHLVDGVIYICKCIFGYIVLKYLSKYSWTTSCKLISYFTVGMRVYLCMHLD